jgi:hypothetical protein
MRRQVEPKAHAARPPPMMPSRQLPVAGCQPAAVPLILAMMSPATGNWQLATALLLLFAALPLSAAPPSTCGAKDDYGKALCLYQRRSFVEAEAAFRAIVEKDVLSGADADEARPLRRGAAAADQNLLARPGVLRGVELRLSPRRMSQGDGERLTQDWGCHKRTLSCAGSFSS